MEVLAHSCEKHKENASEFQIWHFHWWFWSDIMAVKGLSAVAWFLNACCCCQAFIIALTSDFIPRLVYSMRYSPDQTLTGYVNFSLAFFNTTDFEENHQPALALRGNIQICRSVTHTHFLHSRSAGQSRTHTFFTPDLQVSHAHTLSSLQICRSVTHTHFLHSRSAGQSRTHTFFTPDLQVSHAHTLSSLQICRSVTHTHFLHSRSAGQSRTHTFFTPDLQVSHAHTFSSLHEQVDGVGMLGGVGGIEVWRSALQSQTFFNGMRKWGRVGGWGGGVKEGTSKSAGQPQSHRPFLMEWGGGGGGGDI